MAGGAGNRLRGAGKPKPLVTVGDRPLIAHVIQQLTDAAVSCILLDAVGADGELLEVVRRFTPNGVAVEYLGCEGSTGTAGSVSRIIDAASGEPCLLSTVDTIGPQFTYRDFRSFSEAEHGALLCLLASTTVHDEMPIWVHVGRDGHSVEDFGKHVGPSERCFGNVRWFTGKASQVYLRNSWRHAQDSEVMRFVVRELSGKVKQMTVDPIYDIDTPDDLALAAEWWSRSQKRS